ncbi:MAG: hypothetical protein ACJ8FY_02905 [Gemmataceae bacterium]
MAQASSSVPKLKAAATLPGSLPTVRLEMRHGSAKPTSHEITDLGFLIGSVPGCDLRLPGVNLPPVLCLISRHAAGVMLRKMAPMLPILINGQPAASAALNHGDRITLGAVDLLVRITGVSPEKTGETDSASKAESSLGNRTGSLDEQDRRLKEQAEELETDRAIWYRRRDQLEQECQQMSESSTATARRLQQQERELDLARADIAEREQALRGMRDEVEKKHAEISRRVEEVTAQQEESAATRRELADLRQQLYDRYRERRDRLAGLQEAVRKAARKVQERKRELDAEVARFHSEKRDEGQRQAKLDAREAALMKDSELLAEQKALLDARQEQLQRHLTDRLNECLEREQAVLEERKALERSQDEHQSDLVRLDRHQAVMERRQKQLQVHAKEVDLRFEQLQQASRELEEQAEELDKLRSKTVGEAEELSRHKEEQEKAGHELDQRAAALEGQQAMLATLRTKLERTREEIRQEQGRLAQQQASQAESESELQQRLGEAERIRAELAADKELHDRQRQHFKERQSILEQAITQFRQVQEALSADESRLRQVEAGLTAKAAEQTQQASLVQAQAKDLEEQQKRLAEDDKALRRREETLTKSEQALAALQERLRRRSEDLATRHKEQEDLIRRQAEAVSALHAKERELNEKHREAEESVASRHRDFEAQAVELARQRAELAEREEALRSTSEKIEVVTGQTSEERQKLAEEREQWQADQRRVASDLARQKAELESARNEAQALQLQLPQVQERVQAALEKVNQSRAHLSDHLAEVHGFAQQSRTDLEGLRVQVLKDAEQVRTQERALHQARDEQRLAVAAFRQQLLDWQSQVNELKRTLAQGETRLERRQAEVDEQARQIGSTSLRLAEQAEQLEEQQRAVAQRRGEMERHLNDMREWYRHKLRELAGIPNGEAPAIVHKAPTQGEEGAPAEGDSPYKERDILSLTSEIEPGDRQLGDLLTGLQLIDADTLTTLLGEARRQRRSFRQLLLAGNYLTLYQIALIESGNFDGLALGPLRVIDRLKATSRELTYRVFDPRSNQEALLRHMSESAVQEPGHAEEFRRGFTATAALRHPSLAATWEVLDLAGRPAVLQEYIAGVASGDWPPLAAAPGVWYRLLCQTALGLQAGHEAGLVHGHLEAGHIVLTPEGIVKLTGLGEPAWLATPPATQVEQPTVQSDLRALGEMAAAWSAVGGEAKRPRARPLPPDLQKILQRLTADDENSRYADTAALLADLEAAAASVPANSTAWERFVKQVREQTRYDKFASRSA